MYSVALAATFSSHFLYSSSFFYFIKFLMISSPAKNHYNDYNVNELGNPARLTVCKERPKRQTLSTFDSDRLPVVKTPKRKEKKCIWR